MSESKQLLVDVKEEQRLQCDPPYVVSTLVSVRNVIEMTRLESQLTVVATDVPVLLAHRGYISELIVHGIGPIPAQSNSSQ